MGKDQTPIISVEMHNNAVSGKRKLLKYTIYSNKNFNMKYTAAAQYQLTCTQMHEINVSTERFK